MKLYLANVEPGILPERAWQLMVQWGHQVAGNWLAPPYRQGLEEFAPEVIVYAPHRQEKALPWRDAALRMPLELVKQVPTILWALYPDYLTGWDHGRNTHDDGFLGPVLQMLPYCRATLANSRFTKDLLEARAPGSTFEVCYLCIDKKGIESSIARHQRGSFPHSVMWQHRWATDKNLQGALEVVLDLAPRHREVTFYLGRKEDWDEPFWVPQWLRDLYATRVPELARLSNVQFTQRPPTREEYWELIGGMDIAFSCSYNESFGIAMLEHAYAGAACVVPDRVAYPEVHTGALVVAPSDVEAGIGALLDEPTLWRQVAASSRVNAAQYTVERTVERLLGFTRVRS